MRFSTNVLLNQTGSRKYIYRFPKNVVILCKWNLFLRIENRKAIARRQGYNRNIWSAVKCRMDAKGDHPLLLLLSALSDIINAIWLRAFSARSAPEPFRTVVATLWFVTLPLAFRWIPVTRYKLVLSDELFNLANVPGLGAGSVSAEKMLWTLFLRNIFYIQHL